MPGTVYGTGTAGTVLYVHDEDTVDYIPPTYNSFIQTYTVHSYYSSLSRVVR